MIQRTLTVGLSLCLFGAASTLVLAADSYAEGRVSKTVVEQVMDAELAPHGGVAGVVKQDHERTNAARAEFTQIERCKALVEAFMDTALLVINAQEESAVYSSLASSLGTGGDVRQSVSQLELVRSKYLLARSPERRALLVNMCSSSSADRGIVIETLHSLISDPAVSLDTVLQTLMLPGRG